MSSRVKVDNEELIVSDGRDLPHASSAKTPTQTAAMDAEIIDDGSGTEGPSNWARPTVIDR
jgi:hypothetical protein